MKDLYIAEMERIAADLEDGGMDPSAAYEAASERAFDAMRETLADKADAIRQRMKDERGSGQ